MSTLLGEQVDKVKMVRGIAKVMGPAEGNE
jgi:hypothetical protein